MKIRLDGDNILHDSFKNDMPVARFTDDGLTNSAKRQFIHEHNCGVDMLEIFERRGHANDLESISVMIREMRRAFAVYRESEYYNERISRSEIDT